ncbi:MAG: hypothetical protein GEV08_03520 [Acidimicrobiia bacterium]|nr:hypothetical protein [Acidimicrobiia bacterium]
MQQMFTQLFLPPERLRTARELLRSFTPPAEQLEAVQRELAAQREQLQAMARELESMERTVSRLATLGEQVRATQDTFVKLMSLFVPPGPPRPSGAAEDAAGTATNDETGEHGTG